MNDKKGGVTVQKQRILCFVIAAAIIAGAGGWTIWRQVQQKKSAVGIAEISVDGEVLYTYDLGKTYVVPERISIPEGTEDNVIEIGTGYVQMVSASCPDHLCVKTGQISKPGESIICLPHRVMITIVERGTGNADAIDAQT